MDDSSIVEPIILTALAPASITQTLSFEVRELLAGQLADSSIAMYRRDVAAYIAYAEAAGLVALHHQTLAAWRDTLALSTEMSPNTINRMLSAVKRIVKQAASKEMILGDIALKFTQVEGVKVKALKKRLKQHARTRIEPEICAVCVRCQINPLSSANETQRSCWPWPLVACVPLSWHHLL